jgi:hypothetical protein
MAALYGQNNRSFLKPGWTRAASSTGRRHRGQTEQASFCKGLTRGPPEAEAAYEEGAAATPAGNVCRCRTRFNLATVGEAGSPRRGALGDRDPSAAARRPTRIVAHATALWHASMLTRPERERGGRCSGRRNELLEEAGAGNVYLRRMILEARAEAGRRESSNGEKTGGRKRTVHRTPPKAGCP